MSRTVFITFLLLICGICIIISEIFKKGQQQLFSWLLFWLSELDNNNSIILQIGETLYLTCTWIIICITVVVTSISCWCCKYKNKHISKKYSTNQNISHYSGYSKYPSIRSLILAFIIISYVWESVRIYQIARAKKAAVLFKGLPTECLPETMTWWQSVLFWAESCLSWHLQDRCEKYHLALLVDPLWEVTPPVVLASMLTGWFTDLMPQLSSALGESFQQLFGKLPVQWQLAVFLGGLGLIVLVILVFYNYRITTPLLKIDCGSRGNTPATNGIRSRKFTAIKYH